jgi:hypothetical protein
MNMDTTTPRIPDTTCCRCLEQFVEGTLYPVLSALMRPSDDPSTLATRLTDVPTITAAVCGDCANALFDLQLRPSVRVVDEQPGAIRLRIRDDAPSFLIPGGHRPGDTAGFPTGGQW